MTTKAAAIQQFLGGFGMEAYTAASVPDDAAFPYLTYDLTVAGWGDGDTNTTVNIWYNTESEAVINAKVEEISQALGIGGKLLGCETGCIWVKRGSPFCQSMLDADNTIKRRYINLTIEFFTI